MSGFNKTRNIIRGNVNITGSLQIDGPIILNNNVASKRGGQLWDVISDRSTKTDINKQYYDLWKESFKGSGLIKKSNIPVSQMFLTLTKGKTINDFPIYVESMNRYKKLTNKYTLFDDVKADKLMKQYTEFYDMWKNVRFEIMKVDILRFVILYHYGGFVSDLDEFPNVNNLNDVIDDKFIIFTPKGRFGYGILYSKKHNDICLNFLRYVKEQIEEKNKIKVYNTWKGRFVLNTTGPRSFKRFLVKYHKNDPNIKYVEVGTILTPDDVKYQLKNIDKLPFLGFQTSEWLNTIGVKEAYSHKEKAREELLSKL
jgi:hypothetical protein